MTTDDEAETETEVRPKNTPAIREYNEIKIFLSIITLKYQK